MKRFLPLTAVLVAGAISLTGCGLIGGNDSNEDAGPQQTASDTFCGQVADGDGFVAANTFDQSDAATIRSAVHALDDLAAADSPDDVKADLAGLSGDLNDYRAVLARKLRAADGDEEISQAILDAQTETEFSLADWQARLLDAENAARESCGLDPRTIETPDTAPADNRSEGDSTTTTAAP